MTDAGNNAKGFKPTTGAAAYQYDNNGNMTQDNHKQFTFAYNYLNLPATMTKGTNVITMTYTADGEKLAKAVTGGATKTYISGIEYSGANLEAIYFSEGRCTPDGATAFFYEYTIKDHLGNARVNFRANGASVIALQENHYYPFGLEIEGPKIQQVGVENQYQYNGKELNEDFGLNLSDYGARWYDAALGRWWSVYTTGAPAHLVRIKRRIPEIKTSDLSLSPACFDLPEEHSFKNQNLLSHKSSKSRPSWYSFVQQALPYDIDKTRIIDGGSNPLALHHF